ncbi:hypothetical protein TgHK011_006479 [Trichoderma gracile]|nr:hypothetical protein TgHK011_006479 [Trichoderma gracile]
MKSLVQPQAPKYRYPHPHGSPGAKPQFRMYRDSRMSVAALLPAFSHPARVSTPPPVVPSQAHRLHLHPPFRSTLAGWLVLLVSLSTSWLLLAGHGHTHALEGNFTRTALAALLLARIHNLTSNFTLPAASKLQLPGTQQTTALAANPPFLAHLDRRLPLSASAPILEPRLRPTRKPQGHT